MLLISKTITKKFPVGRTCAICKQDIPPTDRTILNEDWENPSYNNTLYINFDGGYGQFIDPWSDSKSVTVCHECAHKLCEENPWINALLEPENSHSHPYWEYPQLFKSGHKGWDMDGHTSEEDYSLSVAEHEKAMAKWAELRETYSGKEKD